ncbi:MAG TPA: putative lipopolysaccharide heptosyltransferase III [Flavobacteriales bacterium]|jgi:heptosyltransferase-3|nr:putative lipopolysaccharide heptosyltransferase III [Flavobacteriales bacterium]
MKVLVIKFRNIGDVLLSTPLILNLKNIYPDSIIDFVLNKGCEDMVSNNPNVKNIIIYDRPRIKKLPIFSQLKEEIRFTRNIRHNNYDIVINLTEGERGAQLAFFSGAKIKLGFSVRKGIFSKIKIFDKLGDDKKWQHTVEKDLQFINLLGKEIINKEVKIYWPTEIEQEVDKILSDNSIEQFVHIHPVSRWMFKCWEDDRMAKIIDYLQKDKGIKVIITGAPIKKELDRIDKILRLCKTRPVNLSGMLTLKHLACLSSKAKLFFGVDTAPMHMAAINTPVMALFGASEASKWGPWHNNGKNHYLNDGLQINGCHTVFAESDHTAVYFGAIKKYQGMLNINIEPILKELNELL